MTTSARATVDLKNAIIKTKTTLSNAIGIGRAVKLSNSDQECDVATAGDDLLCYGFSYQAAAATSRIQIVTFGGGPIVPCLVGTGGVTRGTRVKIVSDGVADAATSADAVGWAEQSGLVGDIVGIRLQQSTLE